MSPLDDKQWLLIAGVAFFASLGQFFLTLAYRYDKAPAVAAASYSSVILSVGYGYFFWQEVPESPTWIGALFIVSGGTYLAYSRINGREPAPKS